MTAALYLLAGLYLVSLFVRRWLTLSYARRLPSLPTDPLPPGTLTIAQAILSGDPLLESRLEENLKALKGQTFRWLIDENDTEARRIAEKLKRPNLHVKLCPPCPDKTNPKLWKLQAAAQRVKTPFFAVIDDDTTLSESSASALVEAAKTHTMATGLPCYLSRGLSSGLLAQFVNNNSIFTYLGTSRVLPPFTLNGMGYVMRTDELERIDYFKPILNELTDDLALATLVLRQGGTIHQSKAPLQVQTGVRNFRHYWQMMHRWYVFTLLLLQRQKISSQIIIFLLHGLPPMLMVAMVILSLSAGQSSLWAAVMMYAALCWVSKWVMPEIIAIVLFVLTMLVAPSPFSFVFFVLLFLRWALLHSVQERYFYRDLHRPFISILSELIQPLHLIHSLCSRTIRWRTRLYKVRDTHDFSEVGT